jgi:phosphoglycolate phosphatase/beta-phosphoglucomutase
MIKAILFDFNGVIIDDEPIQMKAYQEVLKAEDINLTEEGYYSALGMDDKAFVKTAFARAGKELTEDKLGTIIEAKTEKHRKMIEDELPLFPGAVNLIKAASGRYALGLVSMARRVEIDHVLERAGLHNAFDAIVSAEDVSCHKPDPECFNLGFKLVDRKLTAAGEFPIIRNQCLVIEDAPPGIAGAKAANMKTLGVTNTVSERELREAGADVVASSLADLSVDAVQYLFGDK